MIPDLFIGITTWDDAHVLPDCLDALARTLGGVRYEVEVFDNGSADDSVAVARGRGCRVHVGSAPQGDALNWLLARSRAPRTLLMHSDVFMLAPGWFGLLTGLLERDCVLVSPEDIGLGNYKRPFGKDKPESSFMFFDTRWAQSAARFDWREALRRLRNGTGGLKGFDFYGDHVTHRMPGVVASDGKRWAMLGVLPSAYFEKPVYTFEDEGIEWERDASHRVYGFGNFYHWNGTLTHYHNWYARWNALWSQKKIDQHGHPVSFFPRYTKRFLEDFRAGTVTYPPVPAGHVKYGPG